MPHLADTSIIPGDDQSKELNVNEISHGSTHLPVLNSQHTNSVTTNMGQTNCDGQNLMSTVSPLLECSTTENVVDTAPNMRTSPPLVISTDISNHLISGTYADNVTNLREQETSVEISTNRNERQISGWKVYCPHIYTPSRIFLAFCSIIFFMMMVVLILLLFFRVSALSAHKLNTVEQLQTVGYNETLSLYRNSLAGKFTETYTESIHGCVTDITFSETYCGKSQFWVPSDKDTQEQTLGESDTENEVKKVILCTWLVTFPTNNNELFSISTFINVSKYSSGLIMVYDGIYSNAIAPPSQSLIFSSEPGKEFSFDIYRNTTIEILFSSNDDGKYDIPQSWLGQNTIKPHIFNTECSLTFSQFMFWGLALACSVFLASFWLANFAFPSFKIFCENRKSIRRSKIIDKTCPILKITESQLTYKTNPTQTKTNLTSESKYDSGVKESEPKPILKSCVNTLKTSMNKQNSKSQSRIIIKPLKVSKYLRPITQKIKSHKYRKSARVVPLTNLSKAKLRTSLGVIPSCIICLSDFLPGTSVRSLPCGHYFHVNCIDQWLNKVTKDTKKSPEKNHICIKCPICNCDVSKGKQTNWGLNH